MAKFKKKGSKAPSGGAIEPSPGYGHISTAAALAAMPTKGTPTRSTKAMKKKVMG